MIKAVTLGAKATSKVGSFLSGKWVWIVVLFLAYPFIVAYMRRQEAKDKVRATKDELQYLEAIAQNPTAQNSELNKVTTDSTIHSIARNIFHHSGYAYPWYDPRRWSENDEDIYLLLKQFNPIPWEVKESYFIISKGRHLQDDCLKVLDDKYYKLLNW